MLETLIIGGWKTRFSNVGFPISQPSQYHYILRMVGDNILNQLIGYPTQVETESWVHTNMCKAQPRYFWIDMQKYTWSWIQTGNLMNTCQWRRAIPTMCASTLPIACWCHCFVPSRADQFHSGQAIKQTIRTQNVGCQNQPVSFGKKMFSEKSKAHYGTTVELGFHERQTQPPVVRCCFGRGFRCLRSTTKLPSNVEQLAGTSLKGGQWRIWGNGRSRLVDPAYLMLAQLFLVKFGLVYLTWICHCMGEWSIQQATIGVQRARADNFRLTGLMIFSYSGGTVHFQCL